MPQAKQEARWPVWLASLIRLVLESLKYVSSLTLKYLQTKSMLRAPVALDWWPLEVAKILALIAKRSLFSDPVSVSVNFCLFRGWSGQRK